MKYIRFKYTKEFEVISKKFLTEGPLSYTKFKNISLDDVGKNFPIYPEIKISSHDG